MYFCFKPRICLPCAHVGSFDLERKHCKYALGLIGADPHLSSDCAIFEAPILAYDVVN